MTQRAPTTGKVTADEIARQTRNDIEAGRLHDQQRLPATADLAQQWGTSTATVTRAMNTLADEGLVIVKGRSSRVVHNPSAGPEQERPHVILIGGYAGSGKTELARIMTRQTRWAVLDKDTTTRAVVEAALLKVGASPHDRESETYLSTVRPAEYEALMAAIVENVECGTSVIASAPFTRELSDQAWCDRLTATLDSLGADLHVVWVSTNADSMRTYLIRRGAARDAGKLAEWDSYLDQIDVNFTPVVPHRIVHNNTDSRPLQQQAAELLSEVRA